MLHGTAGLRRSKFTRIIISHQQRGLGHHRVHMQGTIILSSAGASLKRVWPRLNHQVLRNNHGHTQCGKNSADDAAESPFTDPIGHPCTDAGS